MSWLDSFLVRTLLAGIGVAIVAAPLGCFVVWRRMAYFGDAAAQASILGVALALAFSISIFIGVIVVSLIMALLVTALSKQKYAMDTLLGVLAHCALAFGLVLASFLSGIRIDLMAYLFGDILAVGKNDLIVIWSGVAVVLGLMWWGRSPLLMTTLNPDLAHAAGFSPKREQLILTVALAIVVAVSIKVVGALLIVAFLIIPAATARSFANTPEQMMILATIFGGLSVVGGLQLSYSFDTPTGPSMVCLAAIFFAIISLLKIARNRLI